MDRSQELDALIKRLEGLSPPDAILYGVNDLRARLSQALGFLQLIDMGHLGPLPEPLAETIRLALLNAQEAMKLSDVFLEARRRWMQENQDDMSSESSV